MKTLPAAILAFALLAPACSAAAPEPVLEGVVRHVSDGDTLWLQTDTPHGKPIKLRLRGIDAPEICQGGGPEARAALAGRVAERRVQARGAFEDDYRRRLVTLTIDGDDVGAWMVLHGHAWSARFHGRPGPYAEQEREARARGRGIFADGDPELPRDFRQRHGPCH